MKFFKELFRNKEKKTVLNFITMLLIGVVLIIAGNTVLKKSDREEDKLSLEETAAEKQKDFTSVLEKKLERVLSSVEGVGNSKVIITLENEGEIVVAEDSSIDKSESNESNDGEKHETNIKEENKKILLESNKPLVLKEIQPEIKGVLIVAGGGGDPKVKRSIINAVQALLNVEANKIEVLKMK